LETDVRPEGDMGAKIMLIRFLATVLLIFSPAARPLPAHALDHAEKWSLFRDGELSFRQANELLDTDPEKARNLFQKAVLSYERIVREGDVRNGKIFYNIGNIYFRMGDVGRAILNYRKAEEFIPGDMNLQQNLGYARSRCEDKIEAKPEAQVLRALFFWHYDLSLVNRARLFVLFFNLIWVSAAVLLLRKRIWLRNVMAVCAFVSLLLAVSVGVAAFQQSTSRSGVILEKEIIARKGDSTTYEPSFKEPLHTGTEFKLIEHRTGWYYIELADRRRCWVPDSTAEMI
jgi:tetratricopeptide (TPR) repeat protein